MLKWFQPEYRIVKDCSGDYLAEVRRWWWPFWQHVLWTYAGTEGDAENKLRKLLRLKREPVVKYLGRI
jgi:hypothetical protein